MCSIVGRGFAGVRVSAMDRPMVQKITQQEIVKVLPWSGSAWKLRLPLLCTGPGVQSGAPHCQILCCVFVTGVWTARVLEVKVLPPIESPEEGEDLLGGVFNRLPVFYPTLQVLIGDDSPATFQMDVVMTEEVPRLKVGERVEVLVMSDRSGLSRFKAVRDVYFPDRDVWISEEPYIERECFERLLRKLPALTAPKREKQGISDTKSGKRRPRRLYLDEKSTNTDGEKWMKAVKASSKAKQSNLYEDEEFAVNYRDDDMFEIRNNLEPERPFGTEKQKDIERRLEELEERNL
ncbi:hypothetical protein R1flu_022334 [Riccia fluitans]|uniref:Uncharacterized protein n=1 Tax=Riccia fluitans TaxID=41844 RepID=A0ABD1ZT18_9MARC